MAGSGRGPRPPPLQQVMFTDCCRTVTEFDLALKVDKIRHGRRTRVKKANQTIDLENKKARQSRAFLPSKS
jgi:hypothetical protein